MKSRGIDVEIDESRIGGVVVGYFRKRKLRAGGKGFGYVGRTRRQ